MSNFLNALKTETNYTYTENGAVTHKTTMSNLLDMFAMGAAMRQRSDEDVILMFKKAFEEDATYALKCLFYIRDVRGGQGERRFFRVCTKWLATNHTDYMKRNLKYVPEYGRWDDLYVFVGTPLEADAFQIIKEQLALDCECKTPSLLAKWLKSENTSSAKSRVLGDMTRRYLGMTHKQYRKTLSILRERINVLERLMSAGEWDKIEFDKIPSRAGMIYKNAFARHDLERVQAQPDALTYEAFVKDTTTKVNAKALYPYECVYEASKIMDCDAWWSKNRPALDNIERLAINKYWDNLADYFQNAELNAMAVVDTSGSMTVGSTKAQLPINVAISLGMYCAEKANGPFHGHYISFSSRPQLIEIEGVDFCDKVARIYETNLCQNTNIEATFDLVLNTAIQNRMKQEDLPEKLIIISDMEFDSARGYYSYSWNGYNNPPAQETLMEGIERKWNAHGYKMPELVYWNVNARQNNIPMTAKNGVMFVSGMSPSIFEQIMHNKDAFSLMMDVLNKERYAPIQ